MCVNAVTVFVREINGNSQLPFKCCSSLICFILNGFLMTVYLLFGLLKAIKLQRAIV